MRTLVAALLVLGALVAALLGWGRAGLRAADAEATRLDADAIAAATARARDHAERVARRLEELRHSESQRPYFQYQSLFHDPRGSDEAVVPSPLAAGPSEPAIAGHFQLRGPDAPLTVPTINDEFPELTAEARRDVDSRLRDRLRAQAATLWAVAPAAMAAPPEIARAPAAPPRVAPRRPARPAPVDMPADLPVQVVELSSQQLLNNMVPEQVYAQTRAVAQAPVTPRVPPATVPSSSSSSSSSSPSSSPAPAAVTPRRRPAARPLAPPPPPVQIVVPPLTWRVLPDQTVVALRRIDTPDGSLVQGFVVDRDELAAELAEDAGADFEVVAATDGLLAQAVPIAALGWAVPIEAQADRAAAAIRAEAIRAGFVGRFTPIAILAAVCGLLVVVVVGRAEHLARQRARFAAAAAHELRTPLAGLQLYGDLLADGLGDPGKAHGYAERIRQDAARLGRVVANVLGFSQLERGNLTVQLVNGDLTAAVQRVVEAQVEALERAGARVQVVAPGPVPARFDEDAVARILGNLLDNAEKYARGATDRTIVVDVAPTDAGAVVRVRDRGPGMNARAVRRLFRPFARGAGADAPGGLGLGLSLSRSLARAMRGDLRYRPAPGGGAEFALQLTGPAPTTARPARPA